MGSNDCCCGRHNVAVGSKLIGITSAVLSALSIVGFIWKFVQLKRIQDNVIQLVGHDAFDKHVSENFESRRHTMGGMVGVSIVCLLVAIALIFAVKKNNRFLALPFMIWSILCNIAAGILAACLIFFIAVIDWDKAEREGQVSDLVEAFVVPLVFVVIQFIIYTWWLVVVFAFYRLLKTGHAFDSIPMQTA
ncbi:uncharacterized protein LOC119090943 [Pollicipes pollicipes]|uniref:uncharacterized protein LOC119090943 n=1 Tax=Pollicipes pollicipes TaxID=41117 RepID=UPI001884D25E|nr:uncharacterized protein LOC119090943 [Pollicipes pollicipes]